MSTIFCEIILILDMWFRRFHFLSTAVPTPFPARQNHLCIFGKGHHEEHFCEIILNLDQWFRRRSFKDISHLELCPPLY